VGHLHALDDRSYAAYKAIVGRYEAPDGWVLHVDRVQPDPYAPPTRIRLEIPTDLPGLEILEDRELLATEDRRLAVRDFLTRELHTGFKGTNLSIAAPGQEILERSAVVVLPEGPEDGTSSGDWTLQVRARMALPARGRSWAVAICSKMGAATLPQSHSRQSKIACDAEREVPEPSANSARSLSPHSRSNSFEASGRRISSGSPAPCRTSASDSSSPPR